MSDEKPSNAEVFFNRVDEDALTSVARLAALGNSRILQDSLENGHPHDVCDNQGWFPIHRAASAGHNECVELLLKHSENNFKNTKTYNGETPLYLAALQGHAKVMKTLIQFGADMKITNNELESVLVAAVRGKDETCVKICFECKLNVDAKDAGGWSALHEAAYIGDAKCIEVLLTAGADINIRNSDLSTPLFISAQYGHVECLNTLIKNKASIDMSTKDKASPLFISSQEGHLECVQALLDAGAQVKNMTNTRTTALHTASERGHLNVVKLLIKAGADVNAVSCEGVTALFLAADRDEVDCLIELIESGADINAKLMSFMDENATPLELACTSGSVKCCEELIKRGCDPNRVFLRNTTLETSTLMEAVESEESSCVEILLRYGANPNIPVYSYPIITAAKNCDAANMSLLIKYGADVNVVDKANNLALRITMMKAFLHRAEDEYFALGHKCVKMLLKAGADTTDFLSRCWGYQILNTAIPIPFLKLLLTFHPQEPHIIEYFNDSLHSYKALGEKTDEITRLIENPCSLGHLSRIKVRCILGSKRLSKIDELPLPKMVQNFLRFDDL